jgi:adenylate kinase
MDLVLFGPPGAGKGTQAARLVEMLGVPQISTGDIMRAELASGSERGQRFQQFMKEGKLVPDAEVIELLGERLQQPDAKSGAIFDGYPRTRAQAMALDELLERLGRKVDKVVSIEVPLDNIIRRVVGRRTDEVTGQVYHLEYNPPPQSLVDSGRLMQRKDDTEAVARTRYAKYEAETLPCLPHYEAKGLVSKVDGVGTLDEVTDRIKQAIGK